HPQFVLCRLVTGRFAGSQPAVHAGEFESSPKSHPHPGSREYLGALVISAPLLGTWEFASVNFRGWKASITDFGKWQKKPSEHKLQERQSSTSSIPYGECITTLVVMLVSAQCARVSQVIRRTYSGHPEELNLDHRPALSSGTQRRGK